MRGEQDIKSEEALRLMKRYDRHFFFITGIIMPILFFSVAIFTFIFLSQVDSPFALTLIYIFGYSFLIVVLILFIAYVLIGRKREAMTLLCWYPSQLQYTEERAVINLILSFGVTFLLFLIAHFFYEEWLDFSLLLTALIVSVAFPIGFLYRLKLLKQKLKLYGDSEVRHFTGTPMDILPLIEGVLKEHDFNINIEEEEEKGVEEDLFVEMIEYTTKDSGLIIKIEAAHSIRRKPTSSISLGKFSPSNQDFIRKIQRDIEDVIKKGEDGKSIAK
jgi:hypothetical protein